jgi:hypothetical protein
MAAQHLAAIKIQGAIRRYLYKQRRETGMLIPYYHQKRLQQERKQLQIQSSILAQAHGNNMQYAQPQQQMQYQHMIQ